MGFCRSYDNVNAFLEKTKLMPFKEYAESFNVEEMDYVMSKMWDNLGRVVMDYSTDLDASWDDVEQFIMRDVVEILQCSSETGIVSALVQLRERRESAYMRIFRVAVLRFPQFVDRLEVLFDCKDDEVRAYLGYRTGKAPQMTQIITEPVGKDLWEFFCKDAFRSDSDLVYDSVTLERLLVGTKTGDVLDVYLMLHVRNTYSSFQGRVKGGLVDVCLYVEHKKLNFNYAYYTTVCYMSRFEDYLNVYLQKIITEKTGLEFIIEGDENKLDGSVLPHVYKIESRLEDTRGGSVRSFVKVAYDVDAPAYISFTDSYSVRSLEGTASFKRLGEVEAGMIHGYLGFYGVVPDKYYTKLAGEPCQDYVDISGYVSDLSKITVLEYDADAADKQSATTFCGDMGMATEIVRDVFVEGATCYRAIGKQRIHNAHTIEKWEPTTSVSFMLKEVPDVRVQRILVTEDDPSDADRFFVESETGRWYEYDYSGVGDDYLTPKEIKSFYVKGLTDAGLLRGGVEFLLGEKGDNDTFIERGIGAYIKEVADGLGLKVRLLHRDSYIGMQNDMRCLWKILLRIRDDGRVY